MPLSLQRWTVFMTFMAISVRAAQAIPSASEFLDARWNGDGIECKLINRDDVLSALRSVDEMKCSIWDSRDLERTLTRIGNKAFKGGKPDAIEPNFECTLNSKTGEKAWFNPRDILRSMNFLEDNVPLSLFTDGEKEEWDGTKVPITREEARQEEVDDAIQDYSRAGYLDINAWLYDMPKFWTVNHEKYYDALMGPTSFLCDEKKDELEKVEMDSSDLDRASGAAALTEVIEETGSKYLIREVMTKTILVGSGLSVSKRSKKWSCSDSELVYRSANGLNEKDIMKTACLENGGRFQWKSFLSTTKNPKMKFQTSETGIKTWWELSVGSGAFDISRISMSEHEEEVLWAPRLDFLITNCDNYLHEVGKCEEAWGKTLPCAHDIPVAHVKRADGSSCVDKQAQDDESVEESIGLQKGAPRSLAESPALLAHLRKNHLSSTAGLQMMYAKQDGPSAASDDRSDSISEASSVQFHEDDLGSESSVDFRSVASGDLDDQYSDAGSEGSVQFFEDDPESPRDRAPDTFEDAGSRGRASIEKTHPDNSPY